MTSASPARRPRPCTTRTRTRTGPARRSSATWWPRAVHVVRPATGGDDLLPSARRGGRGVLGAVHRGAAGGAQFHGVELERAIEYRTTSTRAAQHSAPSQRRRSNCSDCRRLCAEFIDAWGERICENGSRQTQRIRIVGSVVDSLDELGLENCQLAGPGTGSAGAPSVEPLDHQTFLDFIGCRREAISVIPRSLRVSGSTNPRFTPRAAAA